VVVGKQLGAAAARERFHDVNVFHAFVVARVAKPAVVGQAHFQVENVVFGHKP
jgi:hypothetical protein